MKSAEQWLKIFSDYDSGSGPDVEHLRKRLRTIYGDNKELIDERVGCFKRVVEAFADHYSLDSPILIVRAPGRVNIMGRHIDHQWGRTNLMAIDREVVMAEKIDKLIYTSKEQKE